VSAHFPAMEAVVSEEVKASVSVMDAVKQASNYLQQFYPKLEDLLVEEVEICDGGDYWRITLGFADPTYKAGITAAFAPERKPRIYKVFKMDRQTGEIVSMKIRERENV
jgi:hypothetical protein